MDTSYNIYDEPLVQMIISLATINGHSLKKTSPNFEGEMCNECHCGIWGLDSSCEILEGTEWVEYTNVLHLVDTALQPCPGNEIREDLTKAFYKELRRLGYRCTVESESIIVAEISITQRVQ